MAKKNESETAVRAASTDPGYEEGEWMGYRNLLCKSCDYTMLDQYQDGSIERLMKRHVATHKLAPRREPKKFTKKREGGE